MRISRRTSGGRGEYELAEYQGLHLRKADLFGHELALRYDSDLLRMSGINIVEQGGKPRLRILDDSTDVVQLHRQIAVSLLLPDPVREDVALAAGEPVIRRGKYAIEHIMLKGIDPVQSRVELSLDHLILCNATHQAEKLTIRERLNDLRRIWENSGTLPDEIAESLESHRVMLTGGEPLGQASVRLVQHLEQSLSDISADMGVVYTQGSDTVPVLLEALHYQRPEPALTLEDIDTTDFELRRRVVAEWKRWANTRGPASVRFRRLVRDAYSSTCLVCGAHFPAVCSIKNAGVDAAHILPWRAYELDHVDNGLCLCKLDHWAFDEGILRVVQDHGVYRAMVREELADIISHVDHEFSINRIRENVGQIPRNRLPADLSNWPSPRFLELLDTYL